MRLLALLVDWLSVGPIVSALLLLGPHADLPAPLPQLAMLMLGVFGLGLARQLWRCDPRAATRLPWWGAGMLAWAAALTWVVGSASERREAAPALVVGAIIWIVALRASARLVRRRTAAPTSG